MATTWGNISSAERKKRAARHMGDTPDKAVRILKPAPKKSSKKVK